MSATYTVKMTRRARGVLIVTALGATVVGTLAFWAPELFNSPNQIADSKLAELVAKTHFANLRKR